MLPYPSYAMQCIAGAGKPCGFLISIIYISFQVLDWRLNLSLAKNPHAYANMIHLDLFFLLVFLGELVA